MTKTRMFLILVTPICTIMLGMAMPWVTALIVASASGLATLTVLIKGWATRRLRFPIVLAALGLGLGAGINTDNVFEERARLEQRTIDRSNARKQRLVRVERAVSALVGSGNESVDNQLEDLSELTYALKNAAPTGATADRFKSFETAMTPWSTYLAKNGTANFEQAAQPRPPSVPEKPEYEKPERKGIGMVWRLSGTYRATMDSGGIVVSRRDDYFVVRDANVPTNSRVNGYVKTIDFTEINIAGGRFATVVVLSDRQAYRESESEYRDEVRESKIEHREAVTAYKQAKKSLEDRQSRYRSDLNSWQNQNTTLQGVRYGAITRTRYNLSLLIAEPKPSEVSN